MSAPAMTGVLGGNSLVAPTWACLQETRESAFYTSAACLCGQALVIIGGTGRDGRYAEVFVYHLNELKWLKGETSGRGPPTRPLYSSATSRGENVAVVWSKIQNGRLVVTLSLLSLAQMEWRSVAIDSAVAPPRRGYSAVMSAEGDVLVFGGESSINDPSPSDTCIVVADDDSTAVIPSEECPPARSDHASCIAPHDNIVVQGGKGVDNVLLGDMWVYDASRRTWVMVGEDGPQRCGHSVSATEHMILLFGGVDRSGAVMNDLWVWDAHAHHWSGPLVVTGGPIPSPRAGHLFSLVWPVIDAESTDDYACFVLYGGVPGPSAAPFHDVHRLTVPTDRQLVVGNTFSDKLVPTSNPLDRAPQHASFDDDEDVGEAMERLRLASGQLEDQERELLELEAAKQAKQEQLRNDRDRIGRQRAVLEGRIQAVDSGSAQRHGAPTGRVTELERQLQQEREKVHALLSQMSLPSNGLHSPQRTAAAAAYLPPPPVPVMAYDPVGFGMAAAAPLPVPIPASQHGRNVVSPPRPLKGAYDTYDTIYNPPSLGGVHASLPVYR